MTSFRDRSPASSIAALLLFAVAFAPACGGGDFTFGGGNGNSPTKVSFKGNLNSVTPVTNRDIVVFVYNINDNIGDRCPCPADPHSATCKGGDNDAVTCIADIDCPGGTCEDPTGKIAVLSSGATDFTVSGLEPGKFGVVFLLDNAGNNADGEINPGDPIAVLDDTDCQISNDIPGKVTVTLKDVDIDFSSLANTNCDSGTPPAPGRARADLITKTTTTTP